MLTKDEHDNLLKEISETGGDTPAMLELMQKLRDDFDEREGMLRKYGETADSTPIEGEAKAEDEIREESAEDNKEDDGLRRDPVTEEQAENLAPDTVPRSEYDELRRKYIERFFTTPSDAKAEQEAITKDGPKTYEDLFKGRDN